jgi:cell wall assembly regulator SMI1
LGIKLPEYYIESLKIHNGGGYFDSYEYLSIKGVLSWWTILNTLLAEGKFQNRKVKSYPQRIQKSWWDKKWIPFAADSAGNLLCIDLNPGKDGTNGQLIYFEQQDGSGPLPSSEETFVSWLEEILSKVKSKELVYEEYGSLSEPLREPMIDISKVEKLERLPYELAKEIWTTIEKGDVAALKKSIDENSIDINKKVDIYDIPLLSRAVAKQQLAIVEYLLSIGADVNIGRAQGSRTPLFWSVWGPKINKDIVQLLLRHGADVNAMTDYDGTPMHAAAMWDHDDMLNLFLEKGGDIVNLKNSNNLNIVDYLKSTSRLKTEFKDGTFQKKVRLTK